MPDSSTAGLPSLSLPSIGINPVNPNNLNTNISQIYSLLSNAPPSLTSLIGPLLQQVYGTSANIMQPIFQQQTSQNVASAQSDAMARGLTGSSIEAGNMTAARTQGNQAYDQYLASVLQNLVPQYTSAATMDIGNIKDYYGNLAGAVGQGYSTNTQMSEFQKMLDAGMTQARQANQAQLWGAGIGAGADILSGAMAGGMFSDIRLKENVRYVGEHKGQKWYSFNYIDREDLPKGQRVGVLGHEVMKSRPECVSLKDGYLAVDYTRLLDA